MRESAVQIAPTVDATLRPTYSLRAGRLCDQTESGHFRPRRRDVLAETQPVIPRQDYSRLPIHRVALEDSKTREMDLEPRERTCLGDSQTELLIKRRA